MKSSAENELKEKILAAVNPALTLAGEGVDFILYPGMHKDSYALLLEEDGGCDSLSALQKGTEQLIASGAIVLTPYGILEYL
ncbi:hypothetical protein [Eubacterium sp. 1001713B170207_170306_E7]|uniref:hypothetical protein n=1 Tax=Eubacterium sp. 1001713B170207_170306_E7 TaxID=2787097 RepID=UPI001899CEA0|nr:hypothetical protein [Eubacterium sp. 1001713B170207_170306_E7]